MDIAKLRKLAENASEAGNFMKAVNNEVKNKEQVRDVVMSEHFKTLREPLIEQQKKTDAKQDKVIEQLKENQLALTSGIQDIMTLNRELPQVTYEERKDLTANIENRFDDEDRQIIDKLGLIQPATLFQSNVDDLAQYQKVVKEKIQQNTRDIVGLKITKKRNVSKELEKKEREKKQLILIYKQLIIQ